MPSAADIIRSTLESEIVRSEIGRVGVRVFKGGFEKKQIDDDGGLLGWLWNSAGRLVGFLLEEGFKLISMSVTFLWSQFVSTTQFIWNFNWNITDTEIEAQINASWSALTGMLGGTLGNAIGYLACGITPAAFIFSFNEPLGAYVLANVTAEAAEEFLANLNNLFRYTFTSMMQTTLLLNFRSARRFIKANANFLAYVLSGGQGGDYQQEVEKLIKAWGAPGSKPWSFAKVVDDAVKSIPNKSLQNFIEEFLEEAWDGCVEAGYVVANSIDTYNAQQKLNPVLGRTRLVEIQPDRTVENERIVLAAPEQLLRNQIVTTLTNYQLDESRDMGTFVGMPVDDYLRAHPQTIRLHIIFYSIQSPPWRRETDQRLVTASYSIPDVNPAKLDWQTIKLACGGVNGYMWGRFRATGSLTNGRQMQVMGATADEAEDRLKALVALSKATLVKKPTLSEDRAEDKTGSYLKQPTRIYPAYFTIFNQYRVAGGRGSGVPMNDGIYKRKNDKIDLWVTEKPEGFEERIIELLKKPGAENEN